MGTRTTDCRKFTPNIFNKSKCSHCFRQREEHSAAALECNRASRKISKCGYLFVAPDWDFNNPLYRTKRWQRRWFVLYDDGELTYSVDEHPETVPQASVDMTRVLEVTTAEDLTGHTNSIAITAPDRVTFVKGTCPEESKWWLNILVAFPKSKGRHKRNATFPGGQTNNNNNNNNNIVGGNRHNSYNNKDVIISPTLTNGLIDVLNNNNNNSWVNDDDVNNSVPGSPTDGQDENNKNVGNEITNRVYTDQPVSSKSPPTRDKIHPDTKAQVRIRNRNRITPTTTTVQDDSEPATSSLIIENVRREEKLKDIANTLTNLSQTNRWSTNNNNNNNNKNNCNQNNHQSNVLLDEKPTRDETDYFPSGLHHHEFHKVINMRPKSLPLASSTAPAIVSAIVKKIPTVTASTTCSSSSITTKGSSTKLSPSHATVIVSMEKKKSSLRVQQPQTKSSDIHQYNRHTTSATITNLQHHLQSQTNERGDPDGGCNLDDLSTNYLSKNSELRVNLPAEEILNSKKGWLMKQDTRTGEWSKHWFTLRGAALFFYRDPVSEERGVLDGVVDVNCLTNILEIVTTRNFGFQLLTWDNRRITLASISANSRNNWINVLRNAAGLQQLQTQPTTTVESKTVDEVDSDLIIKNNTSDDLKSEIEKDFIKAQRNQEIIINKIAIHQDNSPTTVCPTDSSAGIVVKPVVGASPITPLTPKNVLFSSDEEYRTASEGGRRESIDWGSPLSPSPPIPLSIFRAKDRMRSRTGSSPRLHKRSRSSPPSSRRSTVDSIGSDELPIIHSVQEELNIDKELQSRLGSAEKERDILREEAKEREARMSELLTTLERTELQLSARIREMEEARDNLLKQLDETNCNADQVVNRLTSDLEESQKKIHDLEDRLSRGIEENDILYKKLREGNSSSLTNLNRSKMKRVDSLSDLTNLTEIDPYCLDRDMLADEYHELRARFEKAVNEIKAMKKELKESQSQFDNLEISYASLKQDLERRGVEDRSQLQMMAERIQDLTLKYSGSERQVRTLKQKLAKSERRRSLSLKGKEQLTLSKEIEVKVNELETKIEDLEKSSPEKSTSHNSSVDERTARRTAAHLRRRSLESSASADSLQFMVKLNELEKRIETAASSTCSIPEGIIVKCPSTTKISDHLIDRLRCLEGVLVCSKDKIEQSLQQLQTLRSSRTRRSVSPITDRKDSFRFVERCLTEVIKLIRESCDTCVVGDCSTSNPGVTILPENSPIKLALMQLEGQLRNKLSDLLKQRRVLRERNELNSRKDMELLAERIAYESVCFGKLRDSISRAENPSLFGEKQTRAEIAETSQLMSMLKAKLGGKCSFKQNGSVDVLAGVLARRLILSSYRKADNVNRTSVLPPVDPKVIESLLRQQNEINLIAKRYKNNAMETLAAGLAAETLSYISSNDAVQGAVQEAWRQAQETVNAELVQSEIAHIMKRNAERFESSITPSFGFTLTSEERLTFENFADAVHDTLRKEMDIAIKQLTHCYEESIQKMKRGQWRLHLEQERKASEGRQLLSEFADIIAHKALIDARIAVLKGDYSQSNCDSLSIQKSDYSSMHSLQKYENLFDELANDLQICNPDDILAEADFNFIYKKKTIDFLSDKSQLRDMSNALIELEESLVILNSTLNPNTSISMITCDLDNYKDICFKCRDLRNRVNSMMNSAQKLTEPCEHCEQMETNLCKLANQHETELLNIQHEHDKKITILRKQIDGHLNRVKAVESERNNLINEMQLQSNLVKDHERELALITNKLKTKENECQLRDNDNIDMIERFKKHETKYHNLLNECEKLSGKCSRQNEEYAALLQERDYIQAELNKERERSRKLEKRLEMLELEHSKQLECLQEAYRDQILTHCSDISGIPEEETFRLRYQTEIEQLRTLCEKGLSAMESSHRRIIGDSEERHRVEIERLLFEKEQALAEETQATLAALDAMRKAHQSEVQREVARFKQEFLRQFQKGDSCEPVREKEEELEELREEILSFSEKYSIKCVENAALEEKLRTANQKLKHFQQMQQLELRNKQFRAHLASEDLSDTNFVQGLSSSSKDEQPSPDSEHDCDDDINVKQNMMLSSSCNPVNHNSLMPSTATSTTISTITTTTTTTMTTQSEHLNKNLLPILLSETQSPPLPLSSPPSSKSENDIDSSTVSPTRNILDNQIRSDLNEGINPTKDLNVIIGTEMIIDQMKNKSQHLPSSSSTTTIPTNQSLILLPSQSSSSTVLPLKLSNMKNNNNSVKLSSSLYKIDLTNSNNNNNNNSKPVELPKTTTTTKLLNQKLLNMKLINLQINNNNNNKIENSDDKNMKLNLLKQKINHNNNNNNQQKYILKKFNQKNDNNNLIQKKLSYNLNNLSELLINKNSSINNNEIYNNNNNNNNQYCTIASNSNKILSSSLSISSSSNLGTPEKIRKLNNKSINNNDNNIILNGNLLTNCGNNNIDNHHKLLSTSSSSSSSVMTISTKCCSPSPLNGRDVEHNCSHNNNNNNNQSSNLRRFELEI